MSKPRGLKPLGFCLFWEGGWRNAGGMKVFGQAHALCRLPEKKIRQHLALVVPALMEYL